MLIGMPNRSNNASSINIASSNERASSSIHPMVVYGRMKKPFSSDTSNECIEATINFSDTGDPDTSSQRTLSNHSAKSEIIGKSSDDDDGTSNHIYEVASDSELRSVSGPMASTSSLVSSASTSASSFYPAFSPHVSSDSIRNSRGYKFSNFGLNVRNAAAPNSCNSNMKRASSQHVDLKSLERKQHGMLALSGLSAPIRRFNAADLRNEISMQRQNASAAAASAATTAKTTTETNNNNVNRMRLKNNVNETAMEIPYRQIIQMASAISNPEKSKNLHKENVALRRHLHETNNYVDTVEVENEQNYTIMSNKIDDLYDALDEKNRQLNIANLKLGEKGQQIRNLQERINALEKTNQRQQEVIETIRDEANRDKDKYREASKERSELLLRNASLIHQMEYEKREWSLERERLSMELDDVTRELDLQRMLLNGESISEIVQRWESKVFDLEGMIADRDAAIRAQQQRIGELKQVVGARVVGAAELQSSNESISSQKALLNSRVVDSNALTHLKATLLQYLANPNDEQHHKQMIQSICNAVHLSNDETSRLMEKITSRTF